MVVRGGRQSGRIRPFPRKNFHEERHRCPDRGLCGSPAGVTVSYDPTGSGAGITGATDKTLDIGLSSRALKADETGVTGTTIALDGIAIIVNKDSKVEDLTVDQLKQMFTGEITNWSEVGGADGEIVLVGREAGAGTRDGFESIVDVKDACKYAQELTATGAVISAVEDNPWPSATLSLSAVGDTVKAVTVEGVECSEDTVKDGSYKIQRPFVFVTNDSAPLSEQAQAFFDFATSTDAADLIRTAGAVPVNESSSTFAKESDPLMKQTVSSPRRLELPRNAAEWLEAIMNFLFFLCGILAVGCVVLISAYMILSGVPAIRQIGLFRFLFGTEWASTAADPQFGILPFLLSSIYGTLGATLIGVPVGLLTAVFLSKAAGPRVRVVVVTAIELLSGIPSVVFGLLGMQVLVPAVAKTFGKASGACLLSAIVVLSIMILPSIVSVSVTALNAVPPEYEQGSLALGATDTETWFKISVPAAKSGIAAGIVLGVGRAIGEAMAVMMVAGNSPNMPTSLFKSVTFLTTAIAKEMSYASGLQKQALFSIALVLFLFIMLINVVLNIVLKGGSRNE